MRNLLTILSIALLASCNRHMLPTVQHDVHDSIIVKTETVHTRDTVKTPGDTVRLKITIPCPNAVMSQQTKGGKVNLSVNLKDGVLDVDCHTDSLLHIIDSITTTKNKEHYKKTTVTITIKEKVIKYRTPGWCWWLIAAIVAYLGIRFRNPILSIFKGFIK